MDFIACCLYKLSPKITGNHRSHRFNIFTYKERNVSQVTCNIQKVGPSATQDTLKSLRSLDEGKTSIVTVRVTRKWEELDFMSTNDVTSIDMVIVDKRVVVESWSCDRKEFC
ncbi:uncharacterized protein LOC113317127 isoform X1 [Papaver somniferum]|uniref:uncharacterized protein LOC113317127 isoform X1 n=1 Tax=Papaver somniferum TaxID=3469 RepID=UPI000E700285|nr:uncharacterized protein LOC113317127 isoform X1 [Papaver somniferum]